MALRSTRRRFMAFAGAFLGVGRLGAAMAQAPADDDSAPTTIGSWSVYISDYTAAAEPTKDAIATASAQVALGSGPAPITVSANLLLGYGAAPAFDASNLWINTSIDSTPPRPSSPLRVVADGKQIDSFDLSNTFIIGLPKYFGDDLQDLVPVKNLKVVLTGPNGDVVIYEVNLDSTQMVLTTMPMLLSGYLAKHPKPANKAPPRCFLTTACVELIGLDDDCFELTTLRRFRDTVMERTPEGRSAIASYYRLAPAILAEIERRGDERRLLKLHFTHILPSALAARLGLDRAAIRIYGAMMRRLAADYLPVIAATPNREQRLTATQKN